MKVLFTFSYQAWQAGLLRGRGKGFFEDVPVSALAQAVAQGKALRDLPFGQALPGQLAPVVQQERVAGLEQRRLAVGDIERIDGVHGGKGARRLFADAARQLVQQRPSLRPRPHGQAQGQPAEVLHQPQRGGQDRQGILRMR